MLVAESLDACAVDVGKSVDGSGTSHSESDEADTNTVHRIKTKSYKVGLSLGSLRRFETDNPVV